MPPPEASEHTRPRRSRGSGLVGRQYNPPPNRNLGGDQSLRQYWNPMNQRSMVLSYVFSWVKIHSWDANAILRNHYSFLRFLVEPLPWKKWKPWCIIIIPVLRMKAMFSLKEHTSIMILLVIRTPTNISNEIRPLRHGHIPITPTPQIRHRHAQWAPRSLPIDSVSVDTPPAAPCR